MAMQEIAEFYNFSSSQQPNQGTASDARERRTPQVPQLKRLHVWSDGQRSQYKGEKISVECPHGPSRCMLEVWN